MELNITNQQNCTILKISGRIDSYTTPKIKQTIQSLINEGHQNLVMNLSDVIYLSSSGILMFVNLQRQLLDQNAGKIVFTGVPDLIYSNISLAGFDKLFEFYSETNTAIRRF